MAFFFLQHRSCRRWCEDVKKRHGKSTLTQRITIYTPGPSNLGRRPIFTVLLDCDVSYHHVSVNLAVEHLRVKKGTTVIVLSLSLSPTFRQKSNCGAFLRHLGTSQSTLMQRLWDWIVDQPHVNITLWKFQVLYDSFMYPANR